MGVHWHHHMECGNQRGKWRERTEKEVLLSSLPVYSKKFGGFGGVDGGRGRQVVGQPVRGDKAQELSGAVVVDDVRLEDAPRLRHVHVVRHLPCVTRRLTRAMCQLFA